MEEKEVVRLAGDVFGNSRCISSVEEVKSDKRLGTCSYRGVLLDKE